MTETDNKLNWLIEGIDQHVTNDVLVKHDPNSPITQKEWHNLRTEIYQTICFLPYTAMSPNITTASLTSHFLMMCLITLTTPTWQNISTAMLNTLVSRNILVSVLKWLELKKSPRDGK